MDRPHLPRPNIPVGEEGEVEHLAPAVLGREHDGFFVTYDYDNAGNMLAVRENGTSVLAQYGYDDLGRRTSLTRGNGTVTSFSYDAASRLQALAQDLAGSARDLNLGFAYNSAGQIRSTTRDNDAYAWTGAVNVDRAYAVNGLNQLTQSGSVALGYDARGNLTSSGATAYSYDIENRMTAAGGASLSYDPLGRLFYTSGAGGTYFNYSGDRLLTELPNAGAGPFKRYVWGADTDEPLLWYEGSGTSDKRYLHADERGSVVAVSDASGNTVATNAYDEYGIPASGNVGRFQYTGQAWLPEIGLYYYKARMYSPTLGRFMQTDPIGYADGLNWYNYVGGDPVNKTDPSGLAEFPALPAGYCGTQWFDDEGKYHEKIHPCVSGGGGGGGAGGIFGFGGGGGGGGGGGAPGANRPAPPAAPQSVTSKALAVGKDILCSDLTGDLADAVVGTITGGAANFGMNTLNARYAASVGGEIGAVVGRRAILIAAGPQTLISVGVALGTSYAVRYARSKICPVGAGK